MLFASDVLLEIASKNKCVIKVDSFLPQAILPPILKCNSFASNIIPFNSMRPNLIQCLQKVITRLFIWFIHYFFNGELLCCYFDNEYDELWTEY